MKYPDRRGKPASRGPWAAASLLLCGTALAGGTPRAPAPDLILDHGRIYTLDGNQPWAEAVAIGAGKIMAVGSEADILSLRAKRTKVLDLGGLLVTPGLIDSHVHFVDGGWYLRNVPLRDATTMTEVSRRVAQYAVNHAQTDWIQGEGWSYGYPDLPGGEFHKELLDRVSGAHPVFLDSSMAHAAWVNSEALRRAGITRDTPNPSGGEIVRGADGEATGWLKEDAAIKLVQDKIPPPPPRETEAALLAAVHEANRLGITRVDSAGGDYPLLPMLDKMRRDGQLTVRISIADWIDPPSLTPEHLALLQAARARYQDPMLFCCAAKFIMDGVIESHTAYLPGGYADQALRDRHAILPARALQSGGARVEPAGVSGVHACHRRRGDQAGARRLRGIAAPPSAATRAIASSTRRRPTPTTSPASDGWA